LDIIGGNQQQHGTDCVGYGALIAVVVLGFLRISFISRDDVTWTAVTRVSRFR